MIQLERFFSFSSSPNELYIENAQDVWEMAQKNDAKTFRGQIIGHFIIMTMFAWSELPR